MRIAIAGFCLESVSFLPVETTLEEFRRSELSGTAMLDAVRGTNTVCGGFVDHCEQAGAALTAIVFAQGGARGPASDEAFIHYADRICAGLVEQGPFDGVLLNLHGALTTPTRLDPDREIVERVRAVVGREVPVVVALDYHANLDAGILAHATAVFGYRYSPHVDMGETGRRAARCLLRTLAGEIRPVCAIARPEVMVPSIFSATALSPLKELVADAIRLGEESPTYLDVSLFAGFSYADVPNCGFSVLAVADGDAELARDAAERLSERIRAARHALLHPGLVHGLEEGVRLAIERSRAGRRPVVLLEHADRMNDSTYVLKELMRQGARGVAVPYLCDPAAAEAAARIGAGRRATLRLGGWSSDRAGGPVELTGEILFAGEKRYRATGPMGTGQIVDLGRTALIDAGGILVSVVSTFTFAIDEDPFLQFGLDARDFDIIVLRSKTHFRAVYEKLAADILIVDTPDWGPADLTTLPYRHVRTDAVFPFADR